MPSRKKIDANRANSQHSTGPTDTSGTRLNALKHGLMAKGLTSLDNPEVYQAFHDALINEYNPEGAIQEFLIASAALDAVRWQRAQMLEASFVLSTQNPPVYEKDFLEDFTKATRGKEIKAGVSPALRVGVVENLMTFQRYETYFSNRFYRTIHELERQQRMRRGEVLPAPLPIDVNVHSDRSSALETATSDLPAAIQPSDDSSRRSGIVTLEASASEMRVMPTERDDHHNENDTPASSTQHSKLASSINTSNNLNKTYDAPPLWQKGPPKPPWHR